MDEIFRQLGLALNYTQELLIVALILARTVTMIQLTPFFGGNIIPLEIKMGLSAVLTILVWPLARAGVDAATMPVTAIPFVLLMLKEILIGFSIGFINAHMFWVMDMAGRLIDTSRGTSMSEVQDPHSKMRTTPVGDMYTQLFLIIFVAIGGHQVFLEGFLHSFQAMPVDRTISWSDPRIDGFFTHMLRTTAEIWQIAVVLAAPVVAATFITDVVFGILNRVAPQLNAYFMSMPVKAFGGIVMIFVGLTAILARFEDFVLWTVTKVQQTVDLLFL